MKGREVVLFLFPETRWLVLGPGAPYQTVLEIDPTIVPAKGSNPETSFIAIWVPCVSENVLSAYTVLVLFT